VFVQQNVAKNPSAEFTDNQRPTEPWQEQQRLKLQRKPHRSEGKNQCRHDGYAIQVLFDHRRTSCLGSYAAAEHVGQTAAFTAMQQDEED